MALKLADFIDKNSQQRQSISIPEIDYAKGIASAGNVTPTSAAPKNDPASMGLTPGDMVGLAGTVAGAISQITNTLSAAKSTKPVVNRMLGYNEKALATNRKAQHDIDMNQDVAERDLERTVKLRKNTEKSRLRNTASGISQLRANDLAVDLSFLESLIGGQNQIEQQFAGQRIATKGREEQMLSQQGMVEGQTQMQVDDLNERNRDNVYSNMAVNLSGITESMQKVGSDINKAKYRNDFLSTLEDTNPWGVGYTVGKNNTFDMSSKPNNHQNVFKTNVKPAPVFNPYSEEAFNVDLPSFDELAKSYKK